MRNVLIISAVIVSIIVIFDIVTQNYTKQVIKDISEHLEEIKEQLLSEENQWENELEKVGKVEEIWNGYYPKLAYFIEHDELEKVETNIIGLKSYIQTEEVADAVNELEQGIFILRHIENKNKLELKNIF